MNGGVDLHVHSTASDGLHTPSQIVDMALQQGLRAIALTDHDSVDGVSEALGAAAGTPLRVIPGVEISTDADGEVHVLGYWVDSGDESLRGALARFRLGRLERAARILEKLRALRISLSWENLAELAGDGAVGRPHIARAMQDAGYVGSAQEAFERYLGHGRPAYVPRLKLAPPEAMQLILGAGGLPVLAHPYGVTHLLGELTQAGLVGLEAYYGAYSGELVAALSQLAHEHSLVCTGGSDFHGLALLPDNRLGQGELPSACFEALLARRVNAG